MTEEERLQKQREYHKRWRDKHKNKSVEEDQRYHLSLCWSCQNYYGGCSWSDGTFTPVDGWIAVQSKHKWKQKDSNKKVNGWHIFECPLYEKDKEIDE